MKAFVFSTIGISILCLIAGCGVSDVPSQLVSVSDVSVEDASLRNADTFVVLDVRTKAEYDAGHIDGAVNIDVLSSDFEDRIALLDREETYLVHCALNVENGRSEKALDKMKELGFTELESLVGGYEAWKIGGSS